MKPWVKVCGITRAEDARAAIEAGARAVGFILVEESPRFVDARTAAAIARDLPENVARVGVVVNRPVEAVRALVEKIGLTAVQAHGEEPVEDCRAYGVPTVKVFRTAADFEVEDLAPFRDFPVFLDGYAPGARGGTGVRADWSAARAAVEAGYRVLLAGGLGPDSVAEAVRTVGPVAVDLNSGVESEPGRKDPALIRAAVHALETFDDGEEFPWPW